MGRLMQAVLRKLEQHSAALSSLAIRGASVLAGFAVTIMIGSSMGAAATGQFALTAQTAIFLAVIGLLGLDVGVVRHFAKTLASGAPLALATVLRVCTLGFTFMAAIGLILLLAGDLVWLPLFGDVVPREFLIVLCALLVARGGVQLLGALLRSQHRFTSGQFVAALAIPASTAFALVTGIADSVEDALWAASAGGFVAMVFAAITFRRHVRRSVEALDISLKTVLTSSIPLWGVAMATNIGDWYGLAVAASMLGAAEAGYYRVAAQIAAVLQIISVALFAVYSAKISTAYHADDTELVARLARSAVRLSTAAALPASIILLIASEPLLQLIGDEFIAARSLVYILVVGQLAFTLTGPCGLVLAMSGHEKINLIITVAGTLLLLACVPAAAAYAGLEGIAVCISAIMLLRNILAYMIVRYKLGIGIWTGTVRASSMD
ncbi:hypothetical protein CD351_00530 [Erythrobacter sp. KY5]|nr:hypothetical protein CD351_00530 [Erythrobacter sp. KY5]